MPHQCVRCGAQFPEGSGTLLTGCSCGSRFFFFFKEKNPPRQIIALKQEERKEMEKDVEKAIEEMPLQEVKEGIKKKDAPIILDFESIRVTNSGKYEIDLMSLFKRKPIVYKMSEGKYFIDLPSTFQLIKPKQKRSKTRSFREK